MRIPPPQTSSRTLNFLVWVIYAVGIFATILIIVRHFGLSRVVTLNISKLTHDPHVQISTYIENIDKPSVLAFDSKGHLVYTSAANGKIGAVNNRITADSASQILTSGLSKPYGLGFYSEKNKEFLFVAESNGIDYFTYDPVLLKLGKKQQTQELPDDGINPEKSLFIGPRLRDKDLITNSDVGNKTAQFVYIGAGSSCQACIESSWKHASIIESDPVGSYVAQFAKGLRNVLAMALNPVTHTLWAVDSNRTDLKNSTYPDEVNEVLFTQDYGWPGCAGDAQDTVFMPTPTPSDKAGLKPDECRGKVPPKVILPPNSYPTGLTFIPVGGANNPWPKEWQGNLIVVLHGINNNPNGYKIVRFTFDTKGNPSQPQDLVSGWLQNGKIMGTPRDIKVGPDNALYVTDDTAGVIYKINYQP